MFGKFLEGLAMETKAELRSRIMRSNRSKDTKPEIVVRRTLHAMGVRFRLHRKDLPGNPDIVLPKYRLAIFVHGCFWHQHEGCRSASLPKTRKEYWKKKFEANKVRDRRATLALERMGWRVEVIWECEVKKPDILEERLKHILM